MSNFERRYAPVGGHPPPTPISTPLPIHLNQSTIMIASLPGISTTVDGITRQFYGNPGGGAVPWRRVVTP